MHTGGQFSWLYNYTYAHTQSPQSRDVAWTKDVIIIIIIIFSQCEEHDLSWLSYFWQTWATLLNSYYLVSWAIVFFFRLWPEYEVMAKSYKQSWLSNTHRYIILFLWISTCFGFSAHSLSQNKLQFIIKKDKLNKFYMLSIFVYWVRYLYNGSS